MGSCFVELSLADNYLQSSLKLWMGMRRQYRLRSSELGWRLAYIGL